MFTSITKCLPISDKTKQIKKKKCIQTIHCPAIAIKLPNNFANYNHSPKNREKEKMNGEKKRARINNKLLWFT